MEIARKVIAALVGILVIIVLVLLARWTGDQIRNRFFAPKPIVQIIPESQPAPQPEVYNPNKTATYSSVPATGPADFLFPVITLLGASGTFVIHLSRKFSLEK